LDLGANFEIEGRHSAEEVGRALAVAVKRHDAFALRFGLSAAGPMCWTEDGPTVRYSVDDLTTDPDSLANGGPIAWATESVVKPIDIEKGPTVAAMLLRLSETKSILSISSHQLVADAWTIRILVEDLLDEWRRFRSEPVRMRRATRSFVDLLRSLGDESESRVGEGRRSYEPELLKGPNAGVEKELIVGGGSGGEFAFRLGEDCTRRFRRVCGQNAVTAFTGFLSAFVLLLSESGVDSGAPIGVVVSHRDPRHFGRTAGCFVEVVPFKSALAAGMSVSKVLHHIKQDLERARALPGVFCGAADSRIPRTMISMVRDAKAKLSPPNGILVRYQRQSRRHVECDLHLFIHDFGDDVEIVLNYDDSVLSENEVNDLAKRLENILEQLSEGRWAAQRGLCIRAPVQTRAGSFGFSLHHIGLSVWERDLALRRLASQGINLYGESVIDQEIGVELALGGPVGDVLLEVVAPLGPTAPCVGALVRDGEGAYHCCWSVTSVDEIHRHLMQWEVGFSVVSTERQTPLFSDGKVTFVVVDGFGLVEWLVTAGPAPEVEVQVQREDLEIVVESDNRANAIRFLRSLGYIRDEVRPEAIYEVLRTRGKSHHFTLVASQRGSSGVHRIANVSNKTSYMDLTGERQMNQFTNWWERVVIESKKSDGINEHSP